MLSGTHMQILKPYIISQIKVKIPSNMTQFYWVQLKICYVFPGKNVLSGGYSFWYPGIKCYDMKLILKYCDIMSVRCQCILGYMVSKNKGKRNHLFTHIYIHNKIRGNIHGQLQSSFIYVTGTCSCWYLSPLSSDSFCIHFAYSKHLSWLWFFTCKDNPDFEF